MKTYYKHGKQIPRHLAVDAAGVCLPGVTVSVALTATDSAPTGLLIRDTPTDADAAHAGYLARMKTKRAAPPAKAPADPAPLEGHAAYLSRMTRRAKGA